MEERGNYGTIGKAARLYTKEIRDDQSDHGDRRSSALISMIIPVLAGSSLTEDPPGDMEPW
jgi:hypothetical protein